MVKTTHSEAISTPPAEMAMLPTDIRFDRIFICARGWSLQYAGMWRARRLREGYTDAEIAIAETVEKARHEAYIDQRYKWGDPAYGMCPDGKGGMAGGWDAFRNEALDQVILDGSDKPKYAEGAKILRLIQEHTQGRAA